MFDGESADLVHGDVMIDGDRIEAVSGSPIGEAPGGGPSSSTGGAGC
ncbi:hypothetical protein GS416_11020 [Rhodococcus hoagii]|nr:hypothetical protein [Prescottella equi]